MANPSLATGRGKLFRKFGLTDREGFAAAAGFNGTEPAIRFGTGPRHAPVPTEDPVQKSLRVQELCIPPFAQAGRCRNPCVAKLVSVRRTAVFACNACVYHPSLAHARASMHPSLQ